MNSYQKEHLDAYTMVQRHVDTLKKEDKEKLRQLSVSYLSFRSDVARFLSDHFSRTCHLKCYQNQLSACCTREGIIAFFADVVVNTMSSSKKEIDRLKAALMKPNEGNKCVYLSEHGCLWRIKPIVCEMFLCDAAQEEIMGNRPDLARQWEEFRSREKKYKWPDRPVLFETLEKIFLESGLSSPLMYLHNSPGLIRVRKMAGR